MRKIEVMGSGYARPQHRIDNQDLETILDTSDEWIVQRTGIHSRYVSTGVGSRTVRSNTV